MEKANRGAFSLLFYVFCYIAMNYVTTFYSFHQPFWPINYYGFI